jgi:hypothetical protein
VTCQSPCGVTSPRPDLRTRPMTDRPTLACHLPLGRFRQRFRAVLRDDAG